MRAVLIFSLFLASCSTPSSIIVDGINVTTGNQVGGISETVVKKGGVVVYHKADNEKSFREFASLTKVGIGAWALADVSKTLSGAYESVKNTKTAADVTKTGMTEVTTQKAAEESTKRALIEAVPVE